jgi:hypothetical protein
MPGAEGNSLKTEEKIRFDVQKSKEAMPQQ